MGFNVPLMGFRPPPRFDTVAWTNEEVAESALVDGTFVTIDSIALAPLDVDPSKPMVRNISTVNGTLEEGWYKVRFVQGGNQTPWSNAVFNSTLIPLPEDIREWSLVEFDEAGFGIREDGSDPMLRLVQVQAGWVQRVTGKLFDSTLSADDLEAMQEAVKMAVEFAALRADPDFIEGAADFDLIKSFTAGSYSEERRSLGEQNNVIHPWPDLNALLIRLGASTGAGGFPSVGAADVDWERQRYIIDAGKPPWMFPPVGTRGW